MTAQAHVASKRVKGSFWPGPPWAAVVAVPILLVVLLVLMALIRNFFSWPTPESMGWALLGILILALGPIALLLLDGIARQRGTIEWRGLRLSFAQAAAGAAPGSVVPANVAPGTELFDSGMQNLLRTALAASRSRILVVDITDGTSWWETRLLMVLSVAPGQPGEHVVVFVAERGKREHLFLGWGDADILRERLLDARAHLRLAYEAAAKDTIRTSAGQSLTSPDVPGTGPQEVMNGPRAPGGPDAFSLAHHIRRLETTAGSIPGGNPVTAARILDWFYPVLVTDAVDRNAPQEAWVTAVLGTDARHIAVTDDQEYVGLASRAQAVNSLLRGLLIS